MYNVLLLKTYSHEGMYAVMPRSARPPLCFKPNKHNYRNWLKINAACHHARRPLGTRHDPSRRTTDFHISQEKLFYSPVRPAGAHKLHKSHKKESLFSTFWRDFDDARNE